MLNPTVIIPPPPLYDNEFMDAMINNLVKVQPLHDLVDVQPMWGEIPPDGDFKFKVTHTKWRKLPRSFREQLKKNGITSKEWNKQ